MANFGAIHDVFETQQHKALLAVIAWKE